MFCLAFELCVFFSLSLYVWQHLKEATRGLNKKNVNKNIAVVSKYLYWKPETDLKLY